MEDELKELAERIHALRDACDYTPEYVASELGIPADTYME